MDIINLLNGILNFIISAIIALIVGAFLLIASLFVLPSPWVIWILRILRPSLLKRVVAKNERYFNDIVDIILEGKFPRNYSEDSFAQEKLLRIKDLKTELDKIESNMFTIDLLLDLFSTLRFAFSQSGISIMGSTYEEIANYFQNYSSRLFDTSYRQNFAEDIINKFNNVSEHLHDLEHQISEGRFEETNSQHIIQQYTTDFYYFINTEKNTLESNREIVIGSIKSEVYELLEMSN